MTCDFCIVCVCVYACMQMIVNVRMYGTFDTYCFILNASDSTGASFTYNDIHELTVNVC